MLGELHRSGVGASCDRDCVKSIAVLQASCLASNECLLKELKEDSLSADLWQATEKDARLGRMSEPRPVDEADLGTVLLNPRFAVEQLKEDGSTKVRAIDHLSWSPGWRSEASPTERPTKRARKEESVNGHTAPAEKMHHDTLNTLEHTMRMFVEETGQVPGLMKVPCVIFICSVMCCIASWCSGV